MKPRAPKSRDDQPGHRDRLTDQAWPASPARPPRARGRTGGKAAVGMEWMADGWVGGVEIALRKQHDGRSGWDDERRCLGREGGEEGYPTAVQLHDGVFRADSSTSPWGWKCLCAARDHLEPDQGPGLGPSWWTDCLVTDCMQQQHVCGLWVGAVAAPRTRLGCKMRDLGRARRQLIALGPHPLGLEPPFQPLRFCRPAHGNQRLARGFSFSLSHESPRWIRSMNARPPRPRPHFSFPWPRANYQKQKKKKGQNFLSTALSVARRAPAFPKKRFHPSLPSPLGLPERGQAHSSHRLWRTGCDGVDWR